MIKDFLISFRDNFREKTRNPFLGTYLVVWLIRNWDLIYTLFNFDNNQKLSDKITFIQNYYSKIGFIENVFTTILWAFGLLILTYLLLALSRFITNFSEKSITPWIYKVTDSKSIVLKETYDNLRIENNRIEIKLENEREIKKRLFIEVSELEKEIDNLKISSVENKTEKSASENIAINFENEVDVLFNKIKNKKLIDQFINNISAIGEKEQGYIKMEHWDDSTNYFIRLGLLESGQMNSNFSELSITPVGEKVLRRSRLELE